MCQTKTLLWSSFCSFHQNRNNFQHRNLLSSTMHFFTGRRWRKKMFVDASCKSIKDLFVPWCCPPKEIKLTIGGDGQRWATARLEIQKEINACLVSLRSVFRHSLQLQPQMKSKTWNRSFWYLPYLTSLNIHLINHVTC